MGEGLRTGEIVDRDELQFRVFEGGAKNVAADATESVDTNFDCHMTSSFREMKNRNARIRSWAYSGGPVTPIKQKIVASGLGRGNAAHHNPGVDATKGEESQFRTETS